MEPEGPALGEEFVCGFHSFLQSRVEVVAERSGSGRVREIDWPGPRKVGHRWTRRMCAETEFLAKTGRQ